MAAPAIGSVSSPKNTGTTGAVTVSAPSSLATGDLEILVACTDFAQTISITNDGGGSWNLLSGMPIRGATAGPTLYTWWRIRAGGDGDPEITPSGDFSISCRLRVAAGTFDAATPIESVAVLSHASWTAFSWAPGTSTTGSDRLCVVITSNGVDSNTGQAGTNTANTSLSGVGLDLEYNTTSGGGGGFWVAHGTLASAGNMGTWTQTLTGATQTGSVSFAIRPAASTLESGSLDITGAGAVTIANTKQDHISALSVSGAGAVTIANSKQDHLTSLSVSGAGAATVGGSVQDHLTALSLDGTGVVTIDGSVQDHLTALALLGNGSVALGATRQEHITAIDFAAGSSITITSSQIVGDAISSGDLDLTGIGAITIADSVIEALSGDLNMVGSGAINIIGSSVEALSGALTVNGAGSITITDTDYTALSGLLDITGNGRITTLLPGASASALAHPNRGIISEHSKVVKLAVNAERYKLKANSAGNDRKPIVLSGSWILGVQVDYIDAGASTDVYIGDGSRTILDVQGSNTDVYLPMREEVVDATGAGLGVYEPPLITQGLYITIANAGNGGQVYVTVLYQ